MQQASAIQLKSITKTFGSIIANRNIDLDVRYGEILALLGENGSGKTTLMNIISGIYYPDSGHIYVGGEEVSIRSPKDALNLRIGMIHQHFKLVDVFTAAENVVLGLGGSGRFNMSEVADKVRAICDKYGFEIDPNQKVYNMSVSQKQTLEIIKVLYRGADILILDEPTAVLTLIEAGKLFRILRNMREDGKAVVIITHKLNEVLDISDRVSILRRGEYVGTVDTRDATELSLTEMMVGKKVELNIERPVIEHKEKRLSVEHVTLTNRDGIKILDDVNFEAFGGEILGIAGISGCGQKELLEAIAGLQRIDAGGKIDYYPQGEPPRSLLGQSPRQIREMGVALSFVPEDRLGMGLVGSMGMADNMMLKNYDMGRSIFTERKRPRQLAEQIYRDFEVVAPGIHTPVRRLSGGNVQKVLVGRELAAEPSLLMTAYVVRGLDINTSYTIYHLLNEQKKKGVAVIFVGEDLDVLLGLSDRIMVLCGGKISGLVDARSVTKEQVGMMMTKQRYTAGGRA